MLIFNYLCQLMFKQKYIFYFVFIAFISCNSIKNKNSSTNLPGYYEQWLYMKTAGTNILPDVSKYDWNLTNNKRSTSNALLNVSEIGPINVGGRVRAVLVDKKNSNRIICGGVSGGIFISENSGTTWNNINDHELTPSVTGIDQNPFTPEIIYYCTGEGSGNSADLVGKGVFKSTDGGLTFTQLSSTNNSNFNFCWSIKCSLKDSNTLFVATENAGLWRSKDNGTTFARVYNTSAEINDLEVFPDGSVMIAPKGNGVFYSSNGDLGTYSKVSSVISSNTARSEIAYCKNFPKVVYVAVSGPDNSYNGVLNNFYKSSDGGKTFTTKTNPTDKINFGFTWYTMNMNVKNNDSNAIFLSSVTSGYSYNGGSTWSTAEEQHADHHSSYNINNDKIVVGSDGGLCIYNWNNFNTYTSLNNGLNITQFYAGDASPIENKVMGGTQDNGTQQSTNSNKTFSRIQGSDGGYCFYHSDDASIRYVSTQNRNILRQSSSGNKRISDNLSNPGQAWFIHPFHVNPNNGDYVIVPSDRTVFFSKDMGESFNTIGTIVTGRLYASTSSNHANPSVVTGGSNSLIIIDSITTNPKVYNLQPKVPQIIRSSFISGISMVYGKRDEFYIALNNISDSTRIFKVENAFSNTPTFRRIGGNLPKGLPVNYIECDPMNPNTVLFAGTDFGLYVSEDGGINWVKDNRVPSTTITYIKVHKNQKDIYFYTHGRGIFKGMINNSAISSIKTVEEKSSFKLYPVPSKNELNLSLNKNFKQASYKLVNMTGQVILNNEVVNMESKIELDNISAGNYMIELNIDGVIERKKFNIIK